MKISFTIEPKHRSLGAQVLIGRHFLRRVDRNKKKYSRKGRSSSTRKFEDSIQPATVVVG